MAVEKWIKVKVDGQEVEMLEGDLKNLEKGFDKVDKAADKTSTSVDDVAKNGGAIAILDQLTGGLATRMRDAYESTKLFNVSLKGTKTALIATGIGAFVVAAGVVVAYWDEIVGFITRANKTLQENIDYGRIRATQLDDEIKLLDKQAELNELEGKSNVEVLKLKAQKLELLQKENIAIIENLQLQLEQEQSKAREVTLWEQIKIFASEKLGTDIYTQTVYNALNENSERAVELTKQLTEAKAKQFDVEIAIAKARAGDTNAKIGENEPSEALTGASASAEEIKLEKLEVFIDKEINLIKGGNDIRNRIESQAANKRIQIAELEAQQKKDALELYGSALSAFGNLVGQETAAGKAFAIAGALVSTYLNATKAYESQIKVTTPDAPIRAAVAAGVAVASGLANVKAIMAVKTPGNYGGYGAAGSPTVPAPIQPPDFNVVGTSGSNQIAESLSNRVTQPIKAYVVSKEVTTNQELDRNIESTAAFG